MKKVTKLIKLMLVLAGFFEPAHARAEVFLTKKQALELVFDKANRFEQRLLVTSEQVRLEAKKLFPKNPARHFLRITAAYQDERYLGLAVFGDVIGKQRPISYVLAVNPNNSIKQIEIMAYRESHGGQIRQAGYRAQYVGKIYSEALRLGVQIDGISGATLSCRNLTDDVRYQLFFIHNTPLNKDGSSKKPDQAPSPKP